MAYSMTDEVNKVVKEQLLNMEILEGLKNFIGGAPFAQYLLEYISNTARNLERMSFAIAAEDEARLRHLAHRLKGSSGNIGAMKLAWQCVELEALTEEEHSHDQLIAQHEKLSEVFQSTSKAIEAYAEEISTVQHHVA